MGRTLPRAHARGTGAAVICAPFGVHGSEACSLAVRMGIPFGVSELFKRAGLYRVATKTCTFVICNTVKVPYVLTLHLAMYENLTALQITNIQFFVPLGILGLK